MSGGGRPVIAQNGVANNVSYLPPSCFFGNYWIRNMIINSGLMELYLGLSCTIERYRRTEQEI